MARPIIFFICLTLLIGNSGVLAAGPLRIATAANFIRPMGKIAALFSEQTGIPVQNSYGSSGKLFAQINQGAPYDLFLSADMERPQLLVKKGLCQELFQYATGRVVLWSANTSKESKTWQEALTKDRDRIAMANPATAPYGKMAAEALEKAGLLDTVKSRLVYGQSVGQTFQFAQTGGTGSGLIALSQALSEQGRKGRHWPIPEAAPVLQGGCLLQSSTRSHEARLFMEFLASAEIQAVKKEFGYLP